MSFAEMYADYEKNGKVGKPIAKMPWFTAQWINGSTCINDLLREYLREHHYQYRNTLNGTVCFLKGGNWHTCEARVDGNLVRFYLHEHREKEAINC